ncbi:MAG TPA: hypothetical protein VF529_17580 [Solirubrobacteraceae bacterium]
MKGFKRAALGLVLILVAGTATSGATYTASSTNAQTATAAADFGVHVSVDDPSSPIKGTKTISTTVSETAGGTITQVVIQRSPAGTNTWTTICTRNAAPWSCSWDTTGVTDGLYDLRATATNNNGYSRTSVVRQNVRVDNTAPAVTMSSPAAWSRGTITLDTTTLSDGSGSGIANVKYEYKTSASGTWTSTACTGSTSPFSCSFDTNTMTNGTTYDFRAIATDLAGNATTSAAITGRRADNANPSTSTMTDPGTNKSGTVALAGTAADAHSGVASATFEYSVAGAGSWSVACTDTTSPFAGCNWDTTGLNGLFDLRMIVTDVAGNTLASATIANRRIDNIAPSVSMTNPGSPISGTVAFTFSATDTGGSGVTSGKIQFTAAGGSTWSDACSDTTAPYTTCSASTAGVSDGLYDLRAYATDAALNAGTSTPWTNVRIDNFAPSAADVQTANGGATAGVIEAGDSITLTYSEEIDPSSIIAGWDGTGTQNIYVTGTHHNQGDRLMFLSSTSPFPALPLATSPGVDLNADFFANNSPAWAATLTRSGASFTVTFGALVQGGPVNTAAAAAAAMDWFPSSGAKDFLAKPSSTTTRAETGTSDRDF